MYILSASTISHQPSFRNKGFSALIKELDHSSVLLHPDYSEFISPMERRRMSNVLKMSVACAIDCLLSSEKQQPEAIIIGTSMGCCTHTKQFLEKIINAEGGPLSPTSFISSTHNTIAGQLSLILGNNSYNMTHTQNNVSFEQALMDAALYISEGSSTALVGAADEIEANLYNIEKRLDLNDCLSTSGASFFILANKSNAPSDTRIVDVASFVLNNSILNPISDFLRNNDCSPESIDLVLYSNSKENTIVGVNSLFEKSKLMDFQKFSGVYLTNSGFALSYAVDILSQQKYPMIKRILICNNLIPENLGLILLESIDS
ncbi:MAG: beta-ketoacyl synthase chain length factor [Saprospiraceae bacterium]|nr:beta-ketoacyl synthase chain length factor [Saprospiraceae bacterium]